MIIRATVAAIAAAVWLPAVAIAQDAPKAMLSCLTGPANRTFGGTNWLVYSCDDGRSVIVVSAPGNPALPFYFQFFMENGRYRLVGEGTGNKDATDAAYNELKAFTDRDIQGLIDQTRSSPGSQP